MRTMYARVRPNVGGGETWEDDESAALVGSRRHANLDGALMALCGPVAASRTDCSRLWC